MASTTPPRERAPAAATLDEVLTVVALELEHLAAASVALAVWLPVLRAHRR